MEEYADSLILLDKTVLKEGTPEEVMERLMTHRTPEEVESLFVDFSPYNVVDK